MIHCEEDSTQTDSNVFNFSSDSSQRFWHKSFKMDHQFNLQIIQMHAHTCAQMYTMSNARVHVSTITFAYAYIKKKKIFAYLSLLYFFLLLYASLHLVFISLHLQETAYEILIMMHDQDYVLSLLRSPVCVHVCLSLGRVFCLLMTTVFETSFSLLLSVSPFSAPFTSNLVLQPSILFPLLLCLPTSGLNN